MATEDVPSAAVISKGQFISKQTHFFNKNVSEELTKSSNSTVYREKL
jgi:hypothetical protein